MPTKQWRKIPTKRWSNFLLYLTRVLILLILLVVLMPKLAVVCNHWRFSLLHDDQAPLGNSLRVQAPVWSKVFIQWFPASEKER